MWDFMRMFLIFFASVFLRPAFAQKAPWIYFDLGDTIVDTSDMNKIHYYNGAKEYMEGLRDLGIKVGIMTNIPVSWGNTQQEKLNSLKKFISDRWVDSVPFDWSVYEDVLLPYTQAEMKPAEGMYLKALQRAGSCPVGFISENPKEITAAFNLGFATQLFRNEIELYIPLDQIVDYLKTQYQRPWDQDCFDTF